MCSVSCKHARAVMRRQKLACGRNTVVLPTTETKPARYSLMPFSYDVQTCFGQYLLQSAPRNRQLAANSLVRIIMIYKQHLILHKYPDLLLCLFCKYHLRPSSFVLFLALVSICSAVQYSHRTVTVQCSLCVYQCTVRWCCLHCTVRRDLRSLHGGLELTGHELRLS